MPDESAENDPTWTEACRRDEAIRDLLRRYPDRMTLSAVEGVAWELGLSRATLYRLIERYRAARTVEVLVDGGRGRPKGTLGIEPARDLLIREFIEREYLKPTRPPLRRVIGHLATACRQQGLAAPTWRTVKARLQLVDERTRASRRGETELVRARTATPGEYRVTKPQLHQRIAADGTNGLASALPPAGVCRRAAGQQGAPGNLAGVSPTGPPSD